MNIEKMGNSISTYFNGVRKEWGKVVWPEKNQVVVYFVWVLIICTFFTLLIFSLDKIFEFILGFIPNVH